MRIIFDLDSTLADDSHRLHHIMKSPKDWDSYFSECFEDGLVYTTFEVLRALSLDKHLIEIWTGRREGKDSVTRNTTEQWLAKHGLYVREGAENYPGITIERLLMRQQGDHTNDDELKRGWLNMARAANQAPDLVFEDRDRVVNMWRQEGIICFQVAEGKF